jgi:NUMOD1 domain-containing protein
MIKLGTLKSEQHKLNLSLADPNIVSIEVSDLTNNEITIYHSMRAAGKALGIGVSSINNYIQRNQQKPYKGRYTFRKL